jgi:hypothetical protein
VKEGGKKMRNKQIREKELRKDEEKKGQRDDKNKAVPVL